MSSRWRAEKSCETIRNYVVRGAQLAAKRAAAIAAEAKDWAREGEAGLGDAADAAYAAERAQEAAEQALATRGAVEAWIVARQAFDAETYAREASARVNAAIAERIIAQT